jgi:hypothetical protein
LKGQIDAMAVGKEFVRDEMHIAGHAPRSTIRNVGNAEDIHGSYRLTILGGQCSHHAPRDEFHHAERDDYTG